MEIRKAFVRQALVKMAAYLDRHPKARHAIVFMLSGMPALRYRMRAIMNAPVHKKLDADLDLDAASDSEKAWSESEGPIALPLPAGLRTVYVYVDHTVACKINTGVQRVVRGLAVALVRRGERVRYVKWDVSSDQCVLISQAERENLARWNGPAVRDEERAIYPPAGSPRVPIQAHPFAENNWLLVPEVTHITFHAQPVTLDVILWARRMGLNTGFVFYDAIPLRREEFRDMSQKHADYMRQLMLADVVWPISEWSAKDLLSYWRANECADEETMPEVKAIPLPGASNLYERVSLCSEGKKMILSVGTIEPRKNQLALIRAFEAHRKRHPDSEWQLILVGNLHSLVADEIARAVKADKSIKHVGHVSDDELDALYRACSFTVFPSVEEGFGLPILESLWYGKPCLCANFGAMAEIADGGGCLTVDTRDAAALGEGMMRLIDDADLRHALMTEAVTRRIATWGDYAATICRRMDLEADPAAHTGRIFYWIDSALQSPNNASMQWVSRRLAREMMALGMALIPVKWDAACSGFGPVAQEELVSFSKRGGPPPESWQVWQAPDAEDGRGWFLMPNQPLHLVVNDHVALLDHVHKAGLHSVAVSYDEGPAPGKVDKHDSHGFAESQQEHRSILGSYDLVLPASNASRDDLIDFLGAALCRPQGLALKIRSVSFPGGFLGDPRVTDVAESTNDQMTVLCPGPVDPSTDHETVLEAFAQAVQHAGIAMKLVIAGRVDPDLLARVRARVSDHASVIREEEAGDTRLRELFMDCDFTVFPVAGAGSDALVLESLWHGKPCICVGFGVIEEMAEDGGCLMADVGSIAGLSDAIRRMAEDKTLRETLVHEAVKRPIESWRHYAQEVAARLVQAQPATRANILPVSGSDVRKRAQAMHLAPRPRLSICISTYNRADWLAVNLRNWARLYPDPLSGVELLVCDNASSDHTPEAVKPYLGRPDFSYHRNAHNVGMLGNLRETAHHARGEYVWIIGDDDLLMPKSIESILAALEAHPHVPLVYLNYASTRLEDARKIEDFDAFFRDAEPVVQEEPDRTGPIRSICARNQNFFTAIYTLVFRRDHAIRAYSQDTSGRPFSTMQTCIPTTNYVLKHLMEAEGVWIGKPQIVVNLNVSWLKYAPLWILERIPEVYEIAESKGVSGEELDRWRRHDLRSIEYYFNEIYERDPLHNGRYFSPARLVRRFKHLPEFEKLRPRLREVYARAHAKGHPSAMLPVSKVFPESVSSNV